MEGTAERKMEMEDEGSELGEGLREGLVIS